MQTINIVALTVACPRCQAGLGQPCQTNGSGVRPHRERLDAVKPSLDELSAMDDVDMCGKQIHFSIHAVGERVSVLVHEVIEESSPLIGAFRFTVPQWTQLKNAVDPLVEALPHDPRVEAIDTAIDAQRFAKLSSNDD